MHTKVSSKGPNGLLIAALVTKQKALPVEVEEETDVVAPVPVLFSRLTFF